VIGYVPAADRKAYPTHERLTCIGDMREAAQVVRSIK